MRWARERGETKLRFCELAYIRGCGLVGWWDGVLHVSYLLRDDESVVAYEGFAGCFYALFAVRC